MMDRELTPIQFALPYVHEAGVNAHLDNADAMYRAVTWGTIFAPVFEDGWTAGLEGHGPHSIDSDDQNGSALKVDATANVNEFSDAFRANKVWLFGYLAGRYAARHGWATPTRREQFDAEDPILDGVHKSRR